MNGSAQVQPSVRLDFEPDLVVAPITALVPLKPLRPTIKESRKYQQILASVRAIGVVEPPAVIRDPSRKAQFLVLDGHLRIEALKDVGATEVECLVATEDDTYTYNKRINRLTATQEHRMICRAVDRGVPEERLAEALGLDVTSIRRRFRLLDGICPAASELLRDTPCTMAGFEVLRQMTPVRQVEAAQLIIDQNNYSVKFAKALLLATPPEELVDPRKRKPKARTAQTAEQMARMERELTSLQSQAKAYEDSYAVNNLELSVAKKYLEKLLSRPRVVRWLSQNEPDYLEQFQAIAAISTLQPDTTAAAE